MSPITALADELKSTSRPSSESGLSEGQKSSTKARVSYDPSTTQSSRDDDYAVDLQAFHCDLGLPYGYTGGTASKPDQSHINRSAKGFQPGDPSSKDWSFFERISLHHPFRHPFKPSEHPDIEAYDGETIDYKYMRSYVGGLKAGALPWSRRPEFDGFKPERVLDVGCEITAVWMRESLS